jgi:hypothetical protein
MNKFDKMTTEDFDRILTELVEQESAASLLQIPGVYEDLSDHFNNEVLQEWEEEQAEEAEDNN